MRLTNRVLMSAALLVGGPSALVATGDELESTEVQALFDYEGVTAPGEVDGVAFLSDCSDDCGCTDDLACGDECGDGCGDGCGCLAGLGSKKGGNGPGGFGDIKFSGQLRLRYHSEGSQGFSTDVAAGGTPGLGFQGTDEDFLLTRLFLNADWQLTDNVRFYVSGIFAENLQQDTFSPRIIDENRGDFYNLFFDVNLTENLTVRVGRQDHLYGAQRLLSPLDWANTRQRFEGIKFLYAKDDWKIDAWWTVFTPQDADELDEGDYNQRLYGVYSTYTGAKSASYDFYYIGFENTANGAPISTDFSLHTIGSRLWGGQGSWLYEAEGGYQFGRQSGLQQDHRAGFVTLGLGKKLNIAKEWNTTLWCYYDYATGNDEDSDNFNRFNQLFPLAHKYLGFADFAARSNISSPNILLTMAPTKKWSLLFWYYYIAAADQSDIVPGVATMTTDLQNADSEDFIHTLDITAKYTISDKSNILFGLSTVWAGDKLSEPGPAPGGGTSDSIFDPDANFFYTQWTLNF